MRIEEIHIDGYGALADRHITLEDGLVCVEGDNEAGKSTLLSFIRCVFFGFRNALTEDYIGADLRTAPYDPVAGGTKGGHLSVVVQENGQDVHYRIKRKKVGRRVDGELVVEDVTNHRRFETEQAQRVVDRLLGGTREKVFSHLFAVGPDELHALKSLEREEVRSVLFTAEAGVGPGFVQTLKGLKKEEGALFKKGAQKPRINLLLKERTRLQKELREAERELAGYEGERERLQDLAKEEADLEVMRDRLQAAVRHADLRMDARTVLSRLDSLNKEANPLKGQRLPDGKTLNRVERVLERLDAIREAQAGLDQDIASLQEEQEGLRFEEEDADAWKVLGEIPRSDLANDLEAHRHHGALLDRIEGLQGPYIPKEERGTIRRLIDEQKRLSRVVDEQQGELEARKRSLEQSRSKVLPSPVHQQARAVERLDLDERARQVERTEQSVTDLRKRFEAKLRTLGPDWSPENIDAVPTDRTTIANVQAALLPHDQTAASRPTPSGGWALLGTGLALVAVGALLLATNLLGPVVAGALLVGGSLLTALGGLQKAKPPSAKTPPKSLSPEASSILSAFGLNPSVAREDFRALADALSEAKRDKEELEEMRTRLQEATRRFQEASTAIQRTAEDIADALGRPVGPASGDPNPLAAWVSQQVQEAEETNAALRAEAKQIEDEASKLEHRRKEHERLLQSIRQAQQAHGVPDVRSLVDAINASEERDEVESERRAVESAAKRFEAFERQIADVQRARGRDPLGREDFVAKVQGLYEQCRKAHEARTEHEERARRLRERIRERDKREAEREAKQQELEEIWSTYGVQDQAGLLHKREQAQRLYDLQKEIQTEEEKLDMLESNAPGLRNEAIRVSPDEDQALTAGAEDRKKELETRLRENRDAQKTLHSKLSQAVSQDTLGALLTRQKAVEAELVEAREAWAEVALTRFLLERSRAEFEERHGPRVLKRAAEFLAHVTDGRYVKILPAIEDAGYVLERSDGTRVPAVPPNVSRGTFAQVYLLVRLAFTDVMAKDTPLPYVLDDVLVDFDEKRLQRAAQVLAELAKGRQVVLLTHHSHVAKAVADVGGLSVPFHQHKVSV